MKLFCHFLSSAGRVDFLLGLKKTCLRSSSTTVDCISIEFHPRLTWVLSIGKSPFHLNSELINPSIRVFNESEIWNKVVNVNRNLNSLSMSIAGKSWPKFVSDGDPLLRPYVPLGDLRISSKSINKHNFLLGIQGYGSNMSINKHRSQH